MPMIHRFGLWWTDRVLAYSFCSSGFQGLSAICHLGLSLFLVSQGHIRLCPRWLFAIRHNARDVQKLFFVYMRIFKLSRKKSIRDKKKLKIIFVNFKKYWQSFIQLQIYFNKPWCLWVQRGHHLGNTMNDQYYRTDRELFCINWAA
jgi:hypothetical protein